jgi:hypothetical protein
VTRRARRIAAACTALATLAGAASAAGAQTVRVRVVERATSQPVPGAILSLLTADSARVAPGLSDGDGRHELRAPGAGTYRIQVERVGFGTVITLPFELRATETRDQTVLLTSRPTQLAGVRVVDRRTCSPDPARTAATADLWSEARKALTASELAAARRLVPVELRRYRRTLDDRLRVEEERPVESRTGVTQKPYVTPTPAELAQRGYVRDEGNESLYYAPDAGILLSEEFLRDHCFTAVGRADADTLLVGLAFRPIRDRRGVVDVSGTLWLDAPTSELRHLVFRYTNLSGYSDAPHVGGRLEFQRLPNGAWITQRWYVRTARVAGVTDVAGRRGYELLGYQEEGGEAIARGVVLSAGGAGAAGGAGGAVVQGAGGTAAAAATLAGLVYDSTRGAGVTGAHVLITGPNGRFFRDSTDAAGRFRRAVEPGRYTMRVDHPLFAHPAARGELATEVAPGGTAELVAYVPGATTLAGTSSCALPSAAADAPTGMLIGRARDAGTGAALAFAAVTVRWPLSQPLGAGPRVRVTARGQELRVAADAAGRWVACGVPAGVPVHVGGAEPGAGAPVELPPGGVVGRDALIARPPQ